MLVILATFVYAGKKEKSAKYLAKRAAAIHEMDSILRYPWADSYSMMQLADKKCKEFKYDPYLMCAIASSFATQGGYWDLSQERYQEAKRKHPKSLEVYLDYAATFFDYSIRVNPNSSLTREHYFFDIAKSQVDSAKMTFPKSKEPYLWWMIRCSRYAYNDSLVNYFRNEVESFKKAFPKENADFEAAKILSNLEIALEYSNFEDDKLKSDAEFLRNLLAREYYDRIDISTLTSDKLIQMACSYYNSTKSFYMSSDEKSILYEKSLSCAETGLEKCKKSKELETFYRYKLWSAVELQKFYHRNRNEKRRDSLAIEASLAADILMKKNEAQFPQDFFYAAMAYQYANRKEEAVSFYQKALSNQSNTRLPYYDRYHHCDSLTVYENTSDCYYDMKEFEKGIAQRKTLIDLRKKHGGNVTFTDFHRLSRFYYLLGSDTAKTQKERFVAYIAADSICGIIQDSIDVGNMRFTLSEGNTGYFPYNRLVIRNKIDSLNDYKNRESYHTIEMAEDVVRRIGPLVNKSNRENTFVCTAYAIMWRHYYHLNDYINALKYINLELECDPSKKEKYQKIIELLEGMTNDEDEPEEDG
jgi:tetratricopeptide (TPR) repeat protein